MQVALPLTSPEVPGRTTGTEDIKNIFFESYLHPNLILKGMNQLRERQLLFDVTIQTENKRFQAHRAILASCSEYFRAIFTNCMKESRESDIQMMDVSAVGMEIVLDFIYTSRLELNLSNIQEVLSAANYIQLESVIEACLNYLETELDIDNCIDILTLAENYSVKSLTEKVYRFICGHIYELSRRMDFYRLQPKQLAYILSRDYPVDCNELKVLNIVLLWMLKYDEKQKYDYMKILKNIRFNEISVQEVERLLKSLSIRKSDQFYHMIWYLLSPQCNKQEENLNVLCSSAKNSLINYRGMELAIIKIGGFKLTGITNEITYCFPSKGSNHASPAISSSWRHLTTIPHIKQSSFGTAVLNNNIYCVGGSYDISLEEYIHPFGFKYCPISNKWTTISPMNQDRCRFSLNVVDNCLIAVGGNSELEDDTLAALGFHDHTNFSTAEKYNPETDKWEYIARIPEYRIQHAGASFKSSLYISGGLDPSSNVLQTFYCYNSVYDYWTKLAPMPNARADHVMLQIEGKLFVLGGWNEINGNRTLVNTIDVYDLQTQSWSVLTTVPNPKYHAGITSIGDRIYVIGGFCSDDIFRHTATTIECFDIKKKAWYNITPLYPKNIWEHTLATIYIPKFRDDMEVLNDETHPNNDNNNSNNSINNFS